MSASSTDNNPHYKAVIHCSDLNIMVVADLPEQFAYDVSAHYEAPFAAGFNNMVSQNMGSALRVMGMSLTNQAMTAQIWQGSSDVEFSLPLVFQAESDPLVDVVSPISSLLKLTMPREDEEGGLLESPGPRWDPQKLAQALKDPNNKRDLDTAVGNVKKATVDAAKESWDTGFDLSGQITVMGTSAERAKGTVNAASKILSRLAVTAVKNRISLSIGKYMRFDSVVIQSIQQNTAVQPLFGSGVYQRTEATVQFRTFTIPTQRDLEHMYPILGQYSDAARKSLANNPM